jgi:AraC-like DNA-binding protein
MRQVLDAIFGYAWTTIERGAAPYHFRRISRRQTCRMYTALLSRSRLEPAALLTHSDSMRGSRHCEVSCYKVMLAVPS